MIGPKWTPVIDISTTLITIQSLLDNNPLDNEPGFSGKTTSNHKKYKDAVTYEKFRTLIYRNIFNIPYEFSCFESQIRDHYLSKRESILSKLDVLCKKYAKLTTITMQIYRISYIIRIFGC